MIYKSSRPEELEETRGRRSFKERGQRQGRFRMQRRDAQPSAGRGTMARTGGNDEAHKASLVTCHRRDPRSSRSSACGRGQPRAAASLNLRYRQSWRYGSRSVRPFRKRGQQKTFSRQMTIQFSAHSSKTIQVSGPGVSSLAQARLSDGYHSGDNAGKSIPVMPLAGRSRFARRIFLGHRQSPVIRANVR